MIPATAEWNEKQCTLCPEGSCIISFKAEPTTINKRCAAGYPKRLAREQARIKARREKQKIH